MSDGQLLLFIFSLIYVSDAAAWFGERELLFVSFYRKKLSIRNHRFFFPGFKTGVAFLNPLPLLGQGYIISMLPFSISKRGISPLCVENPNPGYGSQSGNQAPHYRWENVESIETDLKKLVINGSEFKKFNSEHSARFWCNFLNQWKAEASAETRNELINNHLRKYFAAKRPERRLPVFRKSTQTLRLYANILFLVAFLLLPLTYIIYRESMQLLYLCVAMWVLMISLSIQTFCLHRRFFPKLIGDRAQHLFLSLFLPATTIRSVDFLSKRFFFDVHPLAFAAATANEHDLEKFQQGVARDIVHPIPFQETGEAVEIAEEFRTEHYLPLIDQMFPELAEMATPTDNIEDPAYCPRCLTPYATDDAECEDCGGISVISN